MRLDRRSVLKGLGAGVGLATLGAPSVLRAQAKPVRIGFMTVKTGPLASGGIQLEQGLIPTALISDRCVPSRAFRSM